MTSVIGANWLAFVLALAIGLLVAWWLWGHPGKSAERHHAPDALDEGAAPARRNQALIDSPSAASQNSAAAAAASEVTAAASTGEATQATAISPAAPPAAGDDLTLLKGVGPKLSTRLRDLGITSFAEIAAWGEADIAAVDAQLGTFAGRATRDNWVEQAGFLARGDHAGYEAKFGKL